MVDNSSSDLTKDILEEQRDTRLITIYNSKNLGVAKANNQGIKRALLDGCNQILIINNDVEFKFWQQWYSYIPLIMLSWFLSVWQSHSWVVGSIFIAMLILSIIV